MRIVAIVIAICALCGLGFLLYGQTQVAGSSLPMVGVTSSLGGGLLTVACTSGTATVTGVTVLMGIGVTPQTYPGDGIYWYGYRSAADTVTVKVCTVAALTPTASVYNIRVIP